MTLHEELAHTFVAVDVARVAQVLAVVAAVLLVVLLPVLQLLLEEGAVA